VLYPPSYEEQLISTDYTNSNIAQQFGGEYYTHVSRIESYKNIDLVLDYVERFNPNFRMVIMGNGPYLTTLENRVRKFTKTSGKKGSFTAAAELVTFTRYCNIFFTGFIREQAKFAILANARASFSLNDEDFGITKVESIAVGTPLIALAAGGALDIMPADLLVERTATDLAIYSNGISFRNATAENLRDAIALHEKTSYSKDAIRQSAAPFSIRNFHRKLEKIINERVR
jgi:glycosyltransferase involved in cell wall biosynthesis